MEVAVRTVVGKVSPAHMGVIAGIIARMGMGMRYRLIVAVTQRVSVQCRALRTEQQQAEQHAPQKLPLSVCPAKKFHAQQSSLFANSKTTFRIE